MPSYSIGDVYFRVTYADRALKYPGVETFVYLGVNLSDEDTEDNWYFQPASDYAHYGSALAENNSERPVVCVNKHDAADMLDTQGLVAAIEAASARRLRP